MSAPVARQPRDYQVADIMAVRAAWGRGITRPAIVWATGLGKTDPVAFIATREAAAGRHVLILAHRGELLTQLRDRCLIYDPSIEVGRVQAGQREHDTMIIVATVQTFARLVAKHDPRLRKPDLIIVDEAHHAAAMTYERIMRWAGCYEEVIYDPVGGTYAAPPTCRALGVTATMDREEKTGLGLGDVWQEAVAERGIVWGVEHGPDPDDPWTTLPVAGMPAAVGWDGPTAERGWLVPLQGRTVVCEHVDLSKAKINRTTGDYADGELGGMVAQDAPEVVKAWWTHAILPDGSHRQTGVFVPTLEAAAAYTEAFAASGVPTKMVDGKTPVAIRGDVYRGTGIYGELATGKINVLVSVGVLTEGFDCPPISCIVMARPTKLDHLYQQIVGRGTRPMDERDWPRFDGGSFYPKSDLLVFDAVGIAREATLRTLVNLVPGAPYRGRPCPDCAQPRPCGCDAADPDDTGAEDYDDGPGREDKRRRLIGPADYDDFDPLAGAGGSDLNWLRTWPDPGYEGIPFLRADAWYGITWHNEDGSWSAGWVTRRGYHDGGWIIESVTEAEARYYVEYYRPAGATAPLGELADRRDRPWRLARKRPSDSALGFAHDLGIVEPENLTAGACSDEIERVLATRRLAQDF